MTEQLAPEERFYSDYDHDNEMWIVWDSKLCRAVSSWATETQAEEDAKRRNGNE